MSGKRTDERWRARDFRFRLRPAAPLTTSYASSNVPPSVGPEGAMARTVGSRPVEVTHLAILGVSLLALTACAAPRAISRASRPAARDGPEEDVVARSV